MVRATILALLATPLALAPFAAPVDEEPAVPALAPDDDDAAAQLMVALWSTRVGAARFALELAQAAAETEADDELRMRIVLERDRIAEWVAVRDRLVDEIVAGSKKLSFQHEGDKLIARVVGREGDLLVLAPNKREVDRISIETLPASFFASQLAKGSAEFKESHLRSWLYVLAQDKRVKKMLRRADTPAEIALKEDAESFYPEFLAESEAMYELESMSMLAAPRGGPAARALAERIRTLRSKHGHRARVQARTDELQELATAALGAVFDSVGLKGAVNGKYEDLGNDRVKLTYDFRLDEQARDWTRVEDHLPILIGGRPELVTDAEAVFKVKAATFQGEGHVGYRHFLPLESPMSVEYSWEYRQGQVNEPKSFGFVMGLLDDGAGSFGGCLGYGSLYTRKGRRGQVSGNHLEEKMSVRSGELHRMRLTHEEYVLTSFYGDTEKARLDTGKSGGNVFFWVYSDMVVALHEIEIVAVVDEHGREAAKEGWIESQLLQMGF